MRTGRLSVVAAETMGWNQRQQPGSASKTGPEENNARPSEISAHLNILKHKSRGGGLNELCRELLVDSVPVNPL